MRKIDPVDRHVRLIRLSSQEQGGEKEQQVIFAFKKYTRCTTMAR